MKSHKTKQENRGTYTYIFDDGTKITIKPGEEGVTEEFIKKLHSLDDSEVYYNHKNWHRPISEKEKQDIKEWEEKHPGEKYQEVWNISIDSVFDEDGNQDKCIYLADNTKATCRKRAEYNMELAKYDFEEPAELTDEEISSILIKSSDLVSWVSDVKDYALQQALLGKNYPKLKLVEGRSNRKYLNEEEVATAVKNAGYDPYEKKVLGITAMTNLLGRTKFNEVLGNLIYKPQGKPTLVLENDKRPAMEINDFIEEREENKYE